MPSTAYRIRVSGASLKALTELSTEPGECPTCYPRIIIATHRIQNTEFRTQKEAVEYRTTIRLIAVARMTLCFNVKRNNFASSDAAIPVAATATAMF